MLKIGLTGNIASGKSTVEALLSDKGYDVIDADNISHNLLKSESVKAEVIKTFSQYDILDNDEISRTKLGKIIFSDEAERKKLENILHPLIREKIEHYFATKQDEKKSVALVSIPLLFEAKFDDLFDKIILIYANDEIRKERLMKRNDLTQEKALNRIAIQMRQDKKKPMSAFIIFNNGSLDDLTLQVNDIENNVLKKIKHD